MALMVGELAAKLRLDKRQFDRGLGESERRGSRFGATIKRAGARAGAAMVAVSVATTALGFKMAATGDEIAKTSQKLGVSTDVYGFMAEAGRR